MKDEPVDPGEKSPPALNAPKVVTFFIGLCLVVHVYRYYWLQPDQNFQLLLTYAFIPARYDFARLAAESFAFPAGVLGDIWTFFTFTFLHADWLHLIVNSLWLLIFGSALARRLGTLRFVIISLLGSVGGAVLHLTFHWGEIIPVVGASAAISAHMAAVSRFAFVPYGPLGRPRSTHPGSYFLPALSIPEVLKNAQAMTFLGAWFAINLLMGLGGGAILGEGAGSIAWQAHIGGFLIGFFLFPFMDPARHIEQENGS